MKLIVQFIGWATLLVAILYFTVGARHALLFENPLACIGIALIGIGLCIDAKRSGRATLANDEPAE